MKRVLAHLLLTATALILTVASLPAAAQSDGAEEDVPMWVQQLGTQLGQSLESPSMSIRHSALQHLAYFAYYYGEDLDLRASVPSLLRTFKRDEDERCRLMALSALHAIGDETAMQEVRRFVVTEKSPQVQLVAFAALMDHYGEETFEGDKKAAKLAKKLFKYYTEDIVVEPPFDVEVVP